MANAPIEVTKITRIFVFSTFVMFIFGLLCSVAAAQFTQEIRNLHVSVSYSLDPRYLLTRR